MEKREAIRRIEEMPTINEKAKHHLKQVVEFCDALGGEVYVVHYPEEIYKGYDFATVHCTLHEPITAKEVRRSSNKIEVITETEWHTLHLDHPAGPPPEMVVFQDTRRQRIRPRLDYYYMDKEGMDYVEGEFQISGFSAHMQRNGKYLNLGF